MGKPLALLSLIRKVLGSYLDPTTGYPDKHVVLSPCACTQKIGKENFHVLSTSLNANLPISGHYITA